MVLHALTKSWWPVLLPSIVAVLFGLRAFAMPELTLAALVILYGAYALTDEIFELAAALREFVGVGHPLPSRLKGVAESLRRSDPAIRDDHWISSK